MSTAVLFDLDDTLIDLQYSRRHGLRAVREILPGLKRVPLEELELVHEEELIATYQGVDFLRVSSACTRGILSHSACHLFDQTK